MTQKEQKFSKVAKFYFCKRFFVMYDLLLLHSIDQNVSACYVYGLRDIVPIFLNCCRQVLKAYEAMANSFIEYFLPALLSLNFS